WKGATSRALVPPWRRLRLCPYPPLPAGLEALLRADARALADAIDTAGFVEIEYLVTADGRRVVLEINPRVSGTMRIASLATGIPIFSLPVLRDVAGDLG